MMLAIWLTVGLILGGVATAMALTWRKWAAAPVRVEEDISGPTCYPKVKR